jgi:hypothetical protein
MALHRLIQVIYCGGLRWIHDCEADKSILITTHQVSEVFIPQAQSSRVVKPGLGTIQERSQQDSYIHTGLIQRPENFTGLLPSGCMQMCIDDQN